MDPEGEEDGANQDLDSMRKGKCAVIKTSTRQVSTATASLSVVYTLNNTRIDHLPPHHWSSSLRLIEAR